MRADRVNVSWDSGKSNWVVRIDAGAETIRRHCKIPKDADEQALRTAARTTLQDEGYDGDVSDVVIER